MDFFFSEGMGLELLDHIFKKIILLNYQSSRNEIKY